MNAEQIRYLHAMGIQPWLLNTRQALSTRLMVIGETPFIGRADALLTAMLESIGLDRNTVHVTDLQSSSHLISQQIASLKPDLFIAAGQQAADFLAGTLIPIIVTFHPDHLLLNPKDKRKAFQDLQQAHILLTN